MKFIILSALLFGGFVPLVFGDEFVVPEEFRSGCKGKSGKVLLEWAAFEVRFL